MRRSDSVSNCSLIAASVVDPCCELADRRIALIVLDSYDGQPIRCIPLQTVVLSGCCELRVEVLQRRGQCRAGCLSGAVGDSDCRGRSLERSVQLVDVFGEDRRVGCVLAAIFVLDAVDQLIGAHPQPLNLPASSDVP